MLLLDTDTPDKAYQVPSKQSRMGPFRYSLWILESEREVAAPSLSMNPGSVRFCSAAAVNRHLRCCASRFHRARRNDVARIRAWDSMGLCCMMKLLSTWRRQFLAGGALESSVTWGVLGWEDHLQGRTPLEPPLRWQKRAGSFKFG